MAAEKVCTFRIFVGNIPDGCTSDDIRKIFEEFGTVVESVCLGRTGFVHMEDDIEGRHAIGELQGRILKGQQISISEARKQTDPRIPAVKLLVRNVSAVVDARGLRNMFKRFGYVLEVELENGDGHVCLEATGDIGSAIKEMNNFVIDDIKMSVEPGPVIHPPEPSPPKNFKPAVPNRQRERNSSWPSFSPNVGPQAFVEDEYYDDSMQFDVNAEYEDSNPFNCGFNGSNPFNDQGPNPFNFPPQQPFCPQFEPPPERILRDPLAHRGHFGSRFRDPPMRGMTQSQGFRGSGLLPTPGRMHRPPNMGFGGMRGMNMRGGAPHVGPSHLVNQNFNEEPELVPRDAFAMPRQNQPQVFYEDEPLSAPPPPTRVPISGSNAFPIGGNGEEMVPRTSFQDLHKRGNGVRRGGRMRGRGRGKRERFTALTEEVTPGERYPVPPMYNPGFRAPLKWSKEEVKRKVKKVKRPLIPAELPDYSLPVPEIPKQSVPAGAVLKAFPPPMNPNYFDPTVSQPGNSSSQVDFTSDDI